MTANFSNRPDDASSTDHRWELWIDRGGGFDILRQQRVTIGGPGGAIPADIVVRSSWRSPVATIVRGESGDAIEIAARSGSDAGTGMVEPLHAEHWLPLDGLANLDGLASNERSNRPDGSGPRLLYRRPSPLSRSAVVTVAPPHRLVRPVDATILMDQTILVGPEAYNHVCIETLSPQGWVLFRRDQQWWIRGRNLAPQTIELDRPWRQDDWSMVIKKR